MALKASDDNGELTLTLDKGDREKLNQSLHEWGFKDYQSLIRFVVSVLLVSEDKTLWITKNSLPSHIRPASHLVNQQWRKKNEKKY